MAVKTDQQINPFIALSPTLERIDAARRPNAKTVCETCPSSVWQATSTTVQCYCRILGSLTWSTMHAQAILECDGRWPKLEKE